MIEDKRRWRVVIDEEERRVSKIIRVENPTAKIVYTLIHTVLVLRKNGTMSLERAYDEEISVATHTYSKMQPVAS